MLAAIAAAGNDTSQPTNRKIRLVLDKQHIRNSTNSSELMILTSSHLIMISSNSNLQIESAAGPSAPAQPQQQLRLPRSKQGTVLTAAEELALARLCLDYTDRNITLDRYQVSAYANNMLLKNPRQHGYATKWLMDRVVGKKWFKGFIQRHPELSVRYAGRLDHRRHAVTKEKLSSLYDKLDTIYR